MKIGFPLSQYPFNFQTNPIICNFASTLYITTQVQSFLFYFHNLKNKSNLAFHLFFLQTNYDFWHLTPLMRNTNLPLHQADQSNEKVEFIMIICGREGEEGCRV